MSFSTTALFHPVVRHLEQYSHLTDEDRAFLLEKTGRLDLPKQHIVCAEGHVCYHIHRIASGLMRTHYNKDGRNVTTGFLAEGAIVTRAFTCPTGASATSPLPTRYQPARPPY